MPSAGPARLAGAVCARNCPTPRRPPRPAARPPLSGLRCHHLALNQGAAVSQSSFATQGQQLLQAQQAQAQQQFASPSSMLFQVAATAGPLAPAAPPGGAPALSTELADQGMAEASAAYQQGDYARAVQLCQVVSRGCHCHCCRRAASPRLTDCSPAACWLAPYRQPSDSMLPA